MGIYKYVFNNRSLATFETTLVQTILGIIESYSMIKNDWWPVFVKVKATTRRRDWECLSLYRLEKLYRLKVFVFNYSIISVESICLQLLYYINWKYLSSTTLLYKLKVFVFNYSINSLVALTTSCESKERILLLEQGSESLCPIYFKLLRKRQWRYQEQLKVSDNFLYFHNQKTWNS